MTVKYPMMNTLMKSVNKVKRKIGRSDAKKIGAFPHFLTISSFFDIIL